MDKDIVGGTIGPVGTYDVALSGGKIVVSVSISPKELLDMLAAKIGGPIPAEVAAFIESTLGLS